MCLFESFIGIGQSVTPFIHTPVEKNPHAPQLIPVIPGRDAPWDMDNRATVTPQTRGKRPALSHCFSLLQAYLDLVVCSVSLMSM
jgi:hypothetical protein